MKVKVITDSGSGLTKEQAAEYGLDFLPLQVIIEDKAYLDGIDLTVEELYDFIDRRVPSSNEHASIRDDRRKI